MSMPRLMSFELSTSVICRATKSAGATMVMVRSAFERSMVEPESFRS